MVLLERSPGKGMTAAKHQLPLHYGDRKGTSVERKVLCGGRTEGRAEGKQRGTVRDNTGRRKEGEAEYDCLSGWEDSHTHIQSLSTYKWYACFTLFFFNSSVDETSVD